MSESATNPGRTFDKAAAVLSIPRSELRLFERV
jgi:hypothetical protein